MAEVFNRYIGNTGKYYRIDDENHTNNDSPRDRGEPISPTAISPASMHKSAIHRPAPRNNPVESLKRILGGVMPKGTDVGDLLLILILLLLYLEKEDEEILIILSVLIFNGFK